VGAVTMSAVISLTLSPMMCGVFLKPHEQGGRWVTRIVEAIDRVFGSIQRGYERLLRSSLRTVPVTLLFTGLVIGSIFFYTRAPTANSRRKRIRVW
jgi:multidrug efflux pump